MPHNLKSESHLDALSQDEINLLWLPFVVYLNTDQQETTRLGWVNEWSTDVNVRREGNFTRNRDEMLEETYLFRGDENSLIMTQSYPHEFQCVYQLVTGLQKLAGIQRTQEKCLKFFFKVRMC